MWYTKTGLSGKWIPTVSGKADKMRKGGAAMGFLDDFSDAITSRALEKYKQLFSNARDDKLQEWWNENQYNDEMDSRIKDVAKDEMRRRGLMY